MINKINLSQIKWLLLFTILPLMAACEKADLPAYGDAEITKVGAYHRYYTTDKDAVTGEFIIAEKELNRTNNFNSDNATATAEFTLPGAGGTFTEAERAKVSLNNLVVYFNVSTAARVTPIEGAPKLGVPADWTKEHKYKIMAADGTTKIWTIKVSLNK